MSTDEVALAVMEVKGIGDEILDTLKTVAPGEAVPVQVAETILDLLGKLLSIGLAAYSSAAGTPITEESLRSLLPNPTPLTAPDSQ